MTGFKIEVDSAKINELLTQIKAEFEYSSDAQKLMSDIAIKMTGEMQRQVTRMGAVGRSGLLRSNIHPETPAPWTAIASANQFYSVYVARGTGDKGLASASEYGWPASWYTPEWHGMAARPFDLAALEAKEDEIMVMITQFAQRAVRPRG